MLGAVGHPMDGGWTGRGSPVAPTVAQVTLAPYEPAHQAPRTDAGRAAQISTHLISPDLTRVQTRDGVVGFIRAEHDGFAALRGLDVKTASRVGRYRTHGLALEAVRLRRRSI